LSPEWLSDSTRNHLRQLRDDGRRILRRPQRLHELAHKPNLAIGSISSERLNALSKINDAKSYLEIGVATGCTLEAVEIRSRVAVEPSPLFRTRRLPPGISLHKCDSDDFFKLHCQPSTRFDAIFLDGLHEFRQTYRDFIKASHHLSSGGFILIDDTIPVDEPSSIPDQRAAEASARNLGLSFPRPWMGDVFKVILVIHRAHPGVEIRTYSEGGRHQTLLWFPSATGKLLPASQTILEQIDACSFRDTFGKGIPSCFKLAETNSIINDYALRSRE